MWRAFAFTTLLLLLGGCTSLPKELEYQPEQQLIPYLPNLTTNQGEMARWSGLIAKVNNEVDRSIIEVVYLPLNNLGQPKQSESSPGRFLAIVDGFIDPDLYAKGRSITLLGTIEAPQTKTIDNHPYHYSVLKVQSHKLWPKQKEVQVIHDDFWFGAPYYGRPVYYYPVRPARPIARPVRR